MKDNVFLIILTGIIFITGCNDMDNISKYNIVKATQRNLNDGTETMLTSGELEDLNTLLKEGIIEIKEAKKWINYTYIKAKLSNNKILDISFYIAEEGYLQINNGNYFKVKLSHKKLFDEFMRKGNKI